MKLIRMLIASCLAFVFFNTANQLFAEESLSLKAKETSLWYLDAIKAQKHSFKKSKDKLLIAIVDDGVRVSHQDLEDFIWTNPKEIPNNNIDDDGNGYIDDVHGWDVADNNNNVVPPEFRLNDFYHGTHLAGVITRTLNQVYGDNAHQQFKIMPIKALADQANHSYIKFGYQGIDYAIDAGANIILTAWGVEHASPDELKILDKAYANDILVISAAGNFPTNKAQYPAAGKHVIAVGSLNKESQLTKNSNYGQFVDVLAPGVDILSSSVNSDDATEIREGTSQASALMAASFALLKHKYAKFSLDELKACLINSAGSIDVSHAKYIANVGAGKLNVNAALDCEVLNHSNQQVSILTSHQSYLFANKQTAKNHSWTISPPGNFKGLRFTTQKNKLPAKGTIDFYANNEGTKTLVSSYPIKDLAKEIFLPHKNVDVVLRAKRMKKKSTLLLAYHAEPLDFSTLFCKDTKYLNRAGIFSDGSGKQNYSFDTSCKWQITAPVGKVVKFNFSELNTQKNIDKIYFFNGKGTHEDIMAIMSGSKQPPEFTSWSNEVLVWFVSDSAIEGTGWTASFDFVDK